MRLSPNEASAIPSQLLNFQSPPFEVFRDPSILPLKFEADGVKVSRCENKLL